MMTVFLIVTPSPMMHRRPITLFSIAAAAADLAAVGDQAAA